MEDIHGRGIVKLVLCMLTTSLNKKVSMCTRIFSYIRIIITLSKVSISAIS